MEEPLFYDPIVFLEISTFRGSTAAYAEHYYGNLVGWTDSDHLVAVWKRMTRREAANLTKKDSYGFKYKAGEQTTRFESEDLLIATAQRTWREYFPEGKLLIMGAHYVRQPQLVLECSSLDLKNELNRIYNACELLGWWDGGNYDQVFKLWEEWKLLWDGINVEAL